MTVSVGLPTHSEGLQVAANFEMGLMGVGHPDTEVRLCLRFLVFEAWGCMYSRMFYFSDMHTTHLSL
jgi:hypothetical protein